MNFDCILYFKYVSCIVDDILFGPTRGINTCSLLFNERLQENWFSQGDLSMYISHVSPNIPTNEPVVYIQKA